MAYGLASKTPDFNAQVNQLVQMAIQSGNPQFLREYSKSPTANRLVVELAQGVVDQQMNGVENMKRLSQPSNVPTVLDQRQMGGLPGMPTYNMFNPSAYEQGGIGAGVVEPDSEPEQMAGGGVVAFQEGGNTSTPENPVAQIIMALDSQIEAAVREGQDPSELVRQRDMVIKTASAETLATAPAFDASGIPIPETVAATALAGTLARSPAAAGLPAALPAAAGLPAALPAAPTTAAPTTSPPKPGMLRQGVDAAKKFTGIGTPSGQMGTLRKGLNKAGLLGLVGGVASEAGDALKNASFPQFLQHLITPESPEEQLANLSFGQAPTPSGPVPAPGERPRKRTSEIDQMIWKAHIQVESGGMQVYPKGHKDAGKPVTSDKGATGISQVVFKTGPDAAKFAGLPWDENKWQYDSVYNEAIGRAYFNRQLDDFGGDVAKTLSAYNYGPGATKNAIAKADKNKRDWKEYIPKETKDHISKVFNIINKNITQMASVAPEKSDFDRTIEFAKANLPQAMGGNTTPYGSAVDKFIDLSGGSVPTPTVANAIKGVTDLSTGTVTEVKKIFGGAPTTAETAAPSGQPGMTAAQFAAEDTQRQQAAQTALDREDRRRIAMALMMSGAKGLQGTSPYALQNLGAGFEEGLKGYAGMREADAKRAATASEKEQDRALKRYERLTTLEIAQVKSALPLLPDENIRALAQARVIVGLSARDRNINGISPEEYQAALALLKTGATSTKTSGFTVKEKS